MEERLQVGKATRSTPRIHPSLRALVKIPCMGIVYKCFSFLYSSVLILGEVISVVVRSDYSQN